MSENYWGKNAVELHYADCEHTRFIPRGHTADHQHCYGCNPELAKVPLPGGCETCRLERERLKVCLQRRRRGPKFGIIGNSSPTETGQPIAPVNVRRERPC